MGWVGSNTIVSSRSLLRWAAADGHWVCLFSALSNTLLFRLRVGGIFSLVTIIAAALTLASGATTSSMSAQTTSGNVGLSSGGVFGCPGDMDEVLFYTFEFILNILVLLVILRTLLFAAKLSRGTATAILAWITERRLMHTFRPGQYFQSTVLR